MAKASSDDKPRVLFIGHGTPWHPSAGHMVRQQMFLSALASVAELTVALFGLSKSAADGAPLSRVIALPDPAPVEHTRWSRAWADMTSSLPRWVGHARTDEARRLVRELNPLSFDAVFSFRIDFAYAAGVLDHPRLILDIDDPEHARVARRIAVSRERLDLRSRLDLWKLRRFEHRAARSAALAFVCQSQDQQRFPHPQPQVVPNGVRVPPLPKQDAEQSRRAVREPKIAFIGNMQAGIASANFDALQWFISNIWPRIHEAVPACRLVLAGSMDDHARQQAAPARNVDALGFVEDLEALLSNVSATVAPIRFGTGTRIKILDSFAHGCPVISTSLGCEGLDVVSGQHLAIADDPDAFAAACTNLITNPALRHQMRHEAYRLVDQQYNADRIADELGIKLDAWLRDLARARPASRASAP